MRLRSKRQRGKEQSTEIEKKKKERKKRGDTHTGKGKRRLFAAFAIVSCYCEALLLGTGVHKGGINHGEKAFSCFFISGSEVEAVESRDPYGTNLLIFRGYYTYVSHTE